MLKNLIMIFALVSLLGGCSVSDVTKQNIDTSQKDNESQEDIVSLKEKEEDSKEAVDQSQLTESEEKKLYHLLQRK